MSEEKNPAGIKQFFVPVLVVIAIGLAFLSGTLWQKNNNLEKGNTGTGDTTQKETSEVTLDTIKGLFKKDVIKIGDAKSKLVFVEMSDPSCPYCHVAGGYNPELSASIDTQTNRFKYVSDGGKYQAPVP